MRYTITKRAAITFSIIIMLLIAIGVTSLNEIKNAQNSTEQVIAKSRRGLKLVEFQTDVSMLLCSAKDYAITRDDKYKEMFLVAKERVEKKWETINKSVDPDELEQLAVIGIEMKELNKNLQPLLQIHSKINRDSINTLIMKIGSNYNEGISHEINSFLHYLIEKARASNIKAKQDRKDAFIFIAIIIISGVVLSIFIVLVTLKFISKPILKLIKISEKIAVRDFNIDFKAGENDEIGALINSFNIMVKEIKNRYAELENFSYIAAHDLKAPLNSIIGSAQLLLDDSENEYNDEEKQLLKNIIGSGKNMNKLISDLLDFAKAGEVEFSKKPQSMSEMLNEIEANLYYSLKEKNVKIVFQKNLPSFICDPIRFPEVWSNLISNAIKYNESTEPVITIGTVENTSYPAKYCFYVKDNGIGIEQEYLEKIFDPFQRAPNDGNYEGTGIGLAIVKKIIEYHNGEIWVTSIKGKGTTFYFTIPKQLTQ